MRRQQLRLVRRALAPIMSSFTTVHAFDLRGLSGRFERASTIPKDELKGQFGFVMPITLV